MRKVGLGSSSRRALQVVLGTAQVALQHGRDVAVALIVQRAVHLKGTVNVRIIFHVQADVRVDLTGPVRYAVGVLEPQRLADPQPELGRLDAHVAV